MEDGCKEADLTEMESVHQITMWREVFLKAKCDKETSPHFVIVTNVDQPKVSGVGDRRLRVLGDTGTTSSLFPTHVAQQEGWDIRPAPGVTLTTANGYRMAVTGIATIYICHRRAKRWIRTPVLIHDQAHDCLISARDQVRIGMLSKNYPEEIVDGEEDELEPVEISDSQSASQIEVDKDITDTSQSSDTSQPGKGL